MTCGVCVLEIMSFNDNKPFWTDFIELYREHRALWDIKSKNYSNKHMRKEGYAILVEKAKEVFPGCDDKFVKAKIESLRASFRREHKKVEASKTRTGSGQEDVYEPTLWYYDLISFITDQEVVRKGVSSLAPPSSFGDITSEVEVEIEETGHIDSPSILEGPDDSTELQDRHENPATSSRCASSTPSPATIASAPRPKRKKTSTLAKKQEEFFEVATTVLANANKHKAFGNNVSFQLEDMERRQQLIAKKLISEILFHGQMGNLKTSSTVVVDQLPQQNWQPTNYMVSANQQFSYDTHYPQNSSASTNIGSSAATPITRQRDEVYQVQSAQRDVREELGSFLRLD